jgi:hypothetical protein
MNKLIAALLLLLCVALVGCEKELPLYSGMPLVRDGLLYKPNSNEPLTARVEEYGKDGQLWAKYTVIDGKREGLHQDYWIDGYAFPSQCFKAGKGIDMSYCTKEKSQ